MTLLCRRLDRVRDSGQAAFIAMRGRRRVGKSRLAEEFAQGSGCPYVYYTAVQQGGKAELDRFVEAVETSGAPRAPDIRAGLRPESWEAALALAAEGTTREKPLILVIDEFPYLEEKEPSIEALLQKVWDRNWQSSPVMILLIGSDEAMMRALTEQGRPLYDRLQEMVVPPLSPADVGDLLDLSPAEALDAYLVIGGFPVLATEWGPGRDLGAYLEEALTDPTSFLVVSGERTLSAEFPAPAPRAVLAAIGAGARAHSAILSHTGLSATTVNDTLESLRKRAVVRRLTPYSTRATTKTVLWEVVDPYLRFWLGFVDREIDLIERGRGSLLLEHFKRDWPTYRGRAIEHLVRDATELLLPDAERFGDARYVGGYWNRAGTVEVDLVGGDKRPVAKRIGFVGSVKWREARPFDRADGLALAAARSEIPGASDSTRLVGVSAQGFDDDAPLDTRLSPDDLIAAWRR
ncbi:MAG TPA: ATP-binding protein [Solirubrobacterales bacterium]|nr:ATP-binding protein [Solirubrobacterales bacterium]